MPLSDTRYWIFDMDGTLTLPVHDFAAIRRSLAIPPDMPILEFIAQLPAEQAQAARVRLDQMEMQLAYQAVAQSGASALLERLLGAGKTLGILTRNSRAIAEVTLQACGLGGYFERAAIVGRETCRPKPLPDGVLHLLAAWGAEKHQTVIVGDYLYDIQAGRDAGIQTVHFDASARFLWPELADYKISRIADLMGLSGL